VMNDQELRAKDTDANYFAIARRGRRERGDDLTQSAQSLESRREKRHRSTPVGRAARDIDREKARNTNRNAHQPLVFPGFLSIDVTAARRPSPTGGGMVASLRGSLRLCVLCVETSQRTPPARRSTNSAS
jgi:hypothetical protein